MALTHRKFLVGAVLASAAVLSTAAFAQVPPDHAINVCQSASFYAGYNSATPYIVATSSGNQTVVVNQTANGGSWRNIGTFNLAAGDYNVVGVSRWTSATGYVVADAVRIRNS